MTAVFNNIGIIGRVKTKEIQETLITLFEFLSTLNKQIFIEDETADSLPQSNLAILPRNKLSQHCDLVIVVGGDGSLLHAAHYVIEKEIPLLGVNRGSLGFLTDILPSQLEKIKDILDGKFILEERFLLTSSITLHETKLGEDDALNEVALIPDAVPHMIEFEIYIDKQFVCSQDSDGLIVATPTGSTAYALSGGGPILHPKLDAIVLVPMFPHGLTNRPIVIEGDREITLIISSNNTTSPRISCDGRDYIATPAESHITIRKKSKKLQLIHPLDYNYYETLRSKLYWGKKLNYTE